MRRRPTSHSKDTHSRENGAAMFEAVLTIPILVVFALGIFDLGNWFFQHYAMSRVAYEGARYAASLGDIREVASGDLSDAANYQELLGVPCIRETLLNTGYPESAAFNIEGHFRVHSRMGTLAERQLANKGNNLIAATDAFSWSCYDETDRLVVAQVSVPFQSALLNTFNINGWIYDANLWPNVRARAMAPYLFSN